MGKKTCLLVALVLSGMMEAAPAPKKVLVLGMTDLEAKPWCQFIVTLNPDKTATLDWYEYPFLGAEIMPVLQSGESFRQSYRMRVTARKIYIEWGGDGDAAYLEVKRQRDGTWKGGISFPNSDGPEGYQDMNGTELSIAGKMTAA